MRKKRECAAKRAAKEMGDDGEGATVHATYYICAHDGCGHMAPQSCGPRIMLKHEGRYQLHKEHYEQHGHNCKRCIELTENGEWGPHGGRDDYMCGHIGCGYYSSSPRPGMCCECVLCGGRVLSETSVFFLFVSFVSARGRRCAYRFVCAALQRTANKPSTATK